MNLGDIWYDVSGNKYEVTKVTTKENDDGSVITNISSKIIN